MQRSIPFYTQRIVPEAVDKGKRVLITSHENAIRGILMHLCDIPEEAMQQLHLPNGLPLVSFIPNGILSSQLSTLVSCSLFTVLHFLSGVQCEKEMYYPTWWWKWKGPDGSSRLWTCCTILVQTMWAWWRLFWTGMYTLAFVQVICHCVVYSYLTPRAFDCFWSFRWKCKLLPTRKLVHQKRLLLLRNLNQGSNDGVRVTSLGCKSGGIACHTKRGHSRKDIVNKQSFVYVKIGIN